jgi:uncharacterized protein YabN with tetrapyrrole methylase and pyrophosphatase domain
MQKTSLERLIETDKNLRAFGFEWLDIGMIFSQIESELEEIKDAIQHNTGKDHLQEEIGDLLHAVVSLCMFAGFDIDHTIEKTVNKLKSRADALKMLVKQKGDDSLRGQNIEYMLKLWHEAKKIL